MPNDLALESMSAAHRAFLTPSGGKLGWQPSKIPLVLLDPA